MCPNTKIDELSLIRATLITQMKDLAQNSLNCEGCTAPCCTFHHNSMRITYTEGLILVNYLVSQQIDLSELAKKCHETIHEYRLDKDIFLKAGARLRRHYTCPFFTGSELGCFIPEQYKPLGCLAFNPTEPLGKGQTCKSAVVSEFSDGEKLEIPQIVLNILKDVFRVF